MDKPKPLDKVFEKRIFRIPDYQRGYAWRVSQLKDFWEDLVNLSDDRFHYTGVLTLKQKSNREIEPDSKEHWLVDELSFDVYSIVDGQQRLTTCVIFLKALIDVFSSVCAGAPGPNQDVYITESLTVTSVVEQFLYRRKPTGDQFRTYLFGYDEDNPSHNYLRFGILGEDGGGAAEESFYTLNLSNAYQYFVEQLKEIHSKDGVPGLTRLYRKLTKQLLFNEYVIEDEFDVFVAFETMNNRGKKLSDLELLKNRLIYLTTLYPDSELDVSSRKNLRDTINGCWMEVYRQLGRNKDHPLNDDEFLRAHWIMYFKYSRKTGQDYIRFLLDDQFSARRIQEFVEVDVAMEEPEEPHPDDIFDEEEGSVTEESREEPAAKTDQFHLKPTDIRDYVNSLSKSAAFWFASFFPTRAKLFSDLEHEWIDRLNRIGMVYFRPLVMAILKQDWEPAERVRVLREIERFIFLDFRVKMARTTHGSSEFYNMARAVDENRATADTIIESLNRRLEYAFNDDGSFRIGSFKELLVKWFKEGGGYYGWSGLRYFLYEYELSLLNDSRQKKVHWNDLLKTGKDQISIEHIYPQTESPEWEAPFAGIPVEVRKYYQGSLGNFLLLSRSINSSLQNDGFASKKQPKFNEAGRKIRNGYSDGSHSEIEVAQNESWGPEQIRQRGLKLLDFMETRWNITFTESVTKEELLFLAGAI